MRALTVAAALGLLAAGYAIGRYRPAHRASGWANWNRYAEHHRLRSAAGQVVLFLEGIGWLVTHPRQSWKAWKHRNDPPPPRSPAVRIIDNPIPDHTVNEED